MVDSDTSECYVFATRRGTTTRTEIRQSFTRSATPAPNTVRSNTGTLHRIVERSPRHWTQKHRTKLAGTDPHNVQRWSV